MNFKFPLALVMLASFSQGLNAQTWTSFGKVNGSHETKCLAIAAGGIFYVGGTDDGGGFPYPSNYIQMRNSGTWTAIPGPDAAIYAMKASGNNLYACGILHDGTNNTNEVARWNGTSWSALGIFPSVGGGYMWALTTDPAGNVYVGGNFANSSSHTYVAKWNGSTWTELGGLNTLHPASSNGVIYALTSDAAGNIYAAGDFEDASLHTFVAKFNGTSWSELGTSTVTTTDPIRALAVDAANNVYCAGDDFTGLGHYVAKFNGSSWTKLGNSIGASSDGLIAALAVNGTNVYAAGHFKNSAGKQYVAKWNGTAWSELGGANSLQANNNINALITDVQGNLYATGAFTNTNGLYVAKYGTPTSIMDGAPVALKKAACLPSYGNGNFRIIAEEMTGTIADVTVYNSVGANVKSISVQAISGKVDANINIASLAIGQYRIVVKDKAGNTGIGTFQKL